MSEVNSSQAQNSTAPANTANAGEFLVELDAKEALAALQNCFSQNSEMILKNDSDPQPVPAKISHIADQKVFLETPALEKVFMFMDLTSIKFFIGTEVYFIKVALEVINDAICFDQNIKVVQLRRRKEPRYNIPEKWNQSAAVWSIELKQKNNAKVIDLSLSGIRFEVPRLTLIINKGDQIRIQYQIFKRAEVVCDAVVRFIMRKPNGTVVLGLEFTQLQKSHKARIGNIVEDLVNHFNLKNSG